MTKKISAELRQHLKRIGRLGGRQSTSKKRRAAKDRERRAKANVSKVKQLWEQAQDSVNRRRATQAMFELDDIIGGLQRIMWRQR